MKKIFSILLLLSLIIIPFKKAHATPTGIGVIGDSATQPYRCIGRGNSTSFTWTEVLALVRGVNFGGEPCEPYNQAWSGETIALNMTSQTDDVITDFQKGNIGRVIIMLGHNDLYANTGTPNVDNLLSIYRTNLNKLINVGVAPSDILIIDVSQENWDGPIKPLVDSFNTALRSLSTEKGTAFASWTAFHTEAACRSTNGGVSYNIGGQIINNVFGDEYHNWRVADGHLGTLANGVFANALMTNFLGIPRITDEEMLSLVGGSVVPSNPPPSCAPSPTLTPLKTFTPTGIFSGTLVPTSTFTLTTVPSSIPTLTAIPSETSIPGTVPVQTVTASSNIITLGETNVLSMSYSGVGNRLVAQQVTLSQSATIQSLSYYVSTASGQLRLGVYSNSGNNPGTLVAETASFTPVTGWNTQPVLTQTVLNPGTYWLAFLPQNDSLAGRVTPSGVGRHYSYTFGALPSAFSGSAVVSDTFHFSLYATLSTGTMDSTPTTPTVPSITPTYTLVSSTLTLVPTSTIIRTPTKTSTPIRTPTVSRTPTSVPASVTPGNTSTGAPIPSITSSIPTQTASNSTITLGETNILSISYSGVGNRLVAQQVTLSQSATIQSLSYYVSTVSGQLRLGVYSNSGNNPGTLVAETAAFTPTTGWNTQPVLTQTVLAPGTYWLAFLPQNNSLAGRVIPSGTGRHYSYTFGALPSTFASSAVVSDTFHFSLYATLSTSAP